MARIIAEIGCVARNPVVASRRLFAVCRWAYFALNQVPVVPRTLKKARGRRHGLAQWQKKYNCAPILIKMDASSSHIESCHAE
ncbi:hypothetical protein [Janthinobacterium sp. ZB1P44]|uniref:hypothetical protein n=1 Tax=Janthinobacterium sp. ZB1P44 TaxID=3424192 RepID=UPI003F295724